MKEILFLTYRNGFKIQRIKIKKKNINNKIKKMDVRWTINFKKIIKMKNIKMELRWKIIFKKIIYDKFFIKV